MNEESVAGCCVHPAGASGGWRQWCSSRSRAAGASGRGGGGAPHGLMPQAHQADGGDGGSNVSGDGRT